MAASLRIKEAGQCSIHTVMKKLYEEKEVTVDIDDWLADLADTTTAGDRAGLVAIIEDLRSMLTTEAEEGGGEEAEEEAPEEGDDDPTCSTLTWGLAFRVYVHGQFSKLGSRFRVLLMRVPYYIADFKKGTLI